MNTLMKKKWKLDSIDNKDNFKSCMSEDDVLVSDEQEA